MTAESPIQLTHGDYTIGWVCALPKEQTAALYMLETKHEDLPNPINDHNAYYLGNIGQHNIVIACLPMGRIGNNSSAVVATRMISTFPNIKIGLMVGIGGGVPPKVRLGDVVVSCAKNGYPGVIQWDMGKTEKDGFKRTGSLDNPPTALLTAISKFDTDPTESRAKMSKYLADFKSRKSDFITTDTLKDVLYKSSYIHAGRSRGSEDDSWEEELEDEGENCNLCDESKILKIPKREGMMIHYGLIASGNQVVKDAVFRNKLRKDFEGNLLCLEMEAAGLMNDFPCIVIRGICDYADSHKNKAWQEHAAAVAAAYAKTLLTMLPVSDINRMQTIKDLFSPTLIKAARDLIAPLWSDKKQQQSTSTPDTTIEAIEKPQAKDTTHEPSHTEVSSQDENTEPETKRVNINDNPISPLPLDRYMDDEPETKSVNISDNPISPPPLDRYMDDSRSPTRHYSKLSIDSGIGWGSIDTPLVLASNPTEVPSLPISPLEESPSINHMLPPWRDVSSGFEQLDAKFRTFDMMRTSIQLYKDKKRNDVEAQWLIQQADERGSQLMQLQMDLEQVEDELRKLEEKRRALSKQETEMKQTIRYLGQRQQDAEEYQLQISKQWASTQRRLDELLYIDGGGREYEYEFTNTKGWRLLEWAIEKDDAEMIKLLLDDSIDLRAKDDTGWNPLISASRNGQADIVRLIIDTGKADIDLKDNNGFTALSWAIKNNHEDVARLLLERGANVDCIRTLTEHTGYVYSVAISRDSRLIASASKDRTIKLWDLATGYCQQTLEGHTDVVWSVSFSHDSALIASASADNTIKIWNAATGYCRQTLESHTAPVRAVAFSHSPRVIVSASVDSTIKLWDLATSQCCRTFEGHRGIVWSVAFLRDSWVVASASRDRTIKLWDIATGQCRMTLEGHTDTICAVAFSYDSKSIASASVDKTIKIWDVATGQCQQTLGGHHDVVFSVQFSRNSKMLVSASKDGTIKLWDVTTGQCRQTLRGHAEMVRSVAVSHDSSMVVSGSCDKTIKLWHTGHMIY
ncbi:hypothetical protein TrVGV298_006457 [Trichoderma virens]|nr:hypothetical protein TrVGV298_006457 [Trichoderma virens]